MGLGYKQLLSEKQFLKVAMRAKALSQRGTFLYAIYYRDGVLYFKTRSATDEHIIYTQRVQLTAASFENIINAKTFRDVEKLVRDGDLKIHCNCPAFLYWGYKYMAWKGGYGLEKEIRRPKIRNPYEQGYVCKHLYLVLQIFPFMTRAIASKFNRWVSDTLKYEENIKQSSYLGKYNVKTNSNLEPESPEGFKIDEGGSVEPLEGGNTSTSSGDQAPTTE